MSKLSKTLEMATAAHNAGLITIDEAREWLGDFDKLPTIETAQSETLDFIAVDYGLTRGVDAYGNPETDADLRARIKTGMGIAESFADPKFSNEHDPEFLTELKKL